jgi:hypothetical protein
MKLFFRLSRSLRCAFFLTLATIIPLFTTQCRTTAGSYKDIGYDAETLKTPPGHNLEKKDYPFDDSGNYRKDWVKSKARGKTRAATGAPPEPTCAKCFGDGSVHAGGFSQYDRITQLLWSLPVSVELLWQLRHRLRLLPASPSPQYHKVVSGDTLFSLAGRYQTSVDDLKRVNGLTSDTIRLGQSLRIP